MRVWIAYTRLFCTHAHSIYIQIYFICIHSHKHHTEHSLAPCVCEEQSPSCGAGVTVLLRDTHRRYIHTHREKAHTSHTHSSSALRPWVHTSTLPHTQRGYTHPVQKEMQKEWLCICISGRQRAKKEKDGYTESAADTPQTQRDNKEEEITAQIQSGDTHKSTRTHKLRLVRVRKGHHTFRTQNSHNTPQTQHSYS